MGKFKMSSVIVLFLLIVVNVYSVDGNNLSLLKEEYKIYIIQAEAIPKDNKEAVAVIGDRIEADAVLELAGEGYIFYKNYKDSEVKRLLKSDEVILMMPRIDLLEKHLSALSRTTKDVLVFIMDDDKLNNEFYGDRSYQTYINKGVDRKLPSNTKVFRIENSKNTFEFIDIFQTDVYKNKIKPIYDVETKVKVMK